MRTLCLNFISTRPCIFCATVPNAITQFSEKMPKHDRKLIQSDYLTLVKIMLPSFHDVFVIVDALDESDNFEAMIQVFGELLSSSSANEKVHILIISRKEIDIEKALGPLSPTCMSSSEYIWKYIHSFIASEVDDRIQCAHLPDPADPDLANSTGPEGS